LMLLLLLQVELLKNRIPYHITGATSQGSRREVRDALSYLVFLSNPRSKMALERCINTPPRNIGDKTQEALFTWIENSSKEYERRARDLELGGNGGHRYMSREGVVPTLMDYLLAIRLLDTTDYEEGNQRDRFVNLAALQDKTSDESDRESKINKLDEDEDDDDDDDDDDNEEEEEEEEDDGEDDDDDDDDGVEDDDDDGDAPVKPSLHLDSALHEELSRNCPLPQRVLSKLFPFVRLYWLLLNATFGHSNPPPLPVVLHALMADIGKLVLCVDVPILG
jgi:hypothetical protein